MLITLTKYYFQLIITNSPLKTLQPPSIAENKTSNFPLNSICEKKKNSREQDNIIIKAKKISKWLNNRN